MEFRFDAAFGAHVDRRARRAVKRLTEAVADDARRHCPAKSGRLRASIVTTDDSVLVGGPLAPYWACVEFGTAPHVIRARRKQALHWEGAAHPVAQVNHPGTPEVAFMRRALYRRRALRGLL